MTPSPLLHLVNISARTRSPVEPLTGDDTRAQIVEAWGQGFNVGALVIIILIVLCNYRKNVLLHKLILLELLFAVWHGIFIFFPAPVYGWVLSSTAVPLYVSYTLHNVVAWIKIKPFLPHWGGRFFIISLLIVQPYWFIETWANFEYFNDTRYDIFETTRYLEPLMRDPWWIFTTVQLVMVINKNYDYTIRSLIKTSPRFGVLLLCMFISVVFLLTDIFVTALVSVQSGINPYWRLALVFKCASDAIFLDDFKSVLDRISSSALRYAANHPNSSRRRGSFPSGSHRRASSVPPRKPSGSRFPAFSHPLHDTQISTNNVPGNHLAEQGPPPTRDEWLEFRSLQGRTLDRSVDQDSAESQPGILAQTTITIDEHDEHDELDKTPDPVSHARSGSQDRMLPHNNLFRPDYGWGEPPAQTDVEAGIPMAPMRAARTNGERNVRFGSR